MLTIHNRHFLKDGQPFFYLGDTAWLLFSKLTEEEIHVYLRNRALKGFTVIQTTLVHFRDYASPAGDRPLTDNDFSRPDAASPYWDLVERTVRKARELNLVMALLPCWGSFARDGSLNPDSARIYGEFLARRLGAFENVLWLLGGDVRGSDAPETFDALGNTLREKTRQLIGFHPFGRCSSSQWFCGKPWLDFHMFQSGHRDRTQRTLGAWDDNAVASEEWMGEENYLYVFRDFERDKLPTLDGEPSYEEIPHGLHDSTQPYWTDREVRRYAWWSCLAGAAGFTYGHNAIMQFWTGKGRGDFGVRQLWDTALHAPGSFQMIHLRRLLEAMDWTEGRNAQELLLDDSGEGDDRNLCFLTPRGLLVYSFTGKPFGLSLKDLPFSPTAAWYSPRMGGLSPFALPDGLFQPPADRESRREDMVLVLLDKKTAADTESRILGI